MFENLSLKQGLDIFAHVKYVSVYSTKLYLFANKEITLFAQENVTY